MATLPSPIDGYVSGAARVASFRAMTVAFAAALAVAVVSLVALGFTTRRSSVVARRERTETQSRSRELADARREAEESTKKAEDAAQEAAAARAAAAETESRLADAERRAFDADRRASEAEQRAEAFQAEILRAESRAAERRAEAAVTPSAGSVLWQLERLRCEREWSEVVGPGVPLPVVWDETLGAVLATEMAIVREVIGTSGEVESAEPVPLSELPQAAATVRLGVELVRTLARSGEEMVVIVGPGSVEVEQRLMSPASPALFDRLRAVAQAVGGELGVESDPESLTARLTLPEG